MGWSRRRGRTDGTLAEIAGAARAAGFLVYVRNDALADLDVQMHGRHEAWECKSKGGKLTPRQQELRAAGWRIRTVVTVNDVLEARKEMMK